MGTVVLSEAQHYLGKIVVNHGATLSQIRHGTVALRGSASNLPDWHANFEAAAADTTRVYTTVEQALAELPSTTYVTLVINDLLPGDAEEAFADAVEALLAVIGQAPVVRLVLRTTSIELAHGALEIACSGCRTSARSRDRPLPRRPLDDGPFAARECVGRPQGARQRAPRWHNDARGIRDHAQQRHICGASTAPVSHDELTRQAYTLDDTLASLLWLYVFDLAQAFRLPMTGSRAHETNHK